MNEFNNHKFKKKYGQNFLKNDRTVERIVDSVPLFKNDLVIEIGPGSGVMTKKLVEKAQVLAYEIDKDLEKTLINNVVGTSNLRIIWGDFLKRNIKKDIENIKYNKLYIIANLPYYITTPIITKIIEEGLEIESMIIMVQKEVATRFSSVPGHKEYSSITVFLNYYFEIIQLFDVKRTEFFPQPNVDSAVIMLKKKEKNKNIKDEEIMFKLIRDSFKYKRKTLRNNLRDYDLNKIETVLKKYNKDLSIRAESIPLEIFIEIANSIQQSD